MPRSAATGAPVFCESRQQMLELREFDLQLAFARPGALRKDVENQRRAVENLAVEDFFEVAALRGRKVVVENHRVHVLPPAEIREFASLAGADERGGIERYHFLPAVTDDFTARRCGQFAKFGERIARGRTVAGFEFDTNEEDPFRPRFSGFDERFQRLLRIKSENPPRRSCSFCSRRACQGRRKRPATLARRCP